MFDPRFVVLMIAGKRVFFPATFIKLTAALRGLLMHNCPEQPPPEWLCGHVSKTPRAAPSRPDGATSSTSRRAPG